MRSGLLLLLTLALSFSLAAQSYQSRIHYKVKLGDTEQLHQLILLDYSKLLGTALEIENDEIFFQLRSSSEVSVIPLKELRFLGVFTGTNGNPVSGLNAATVGLADLTYERTALPYQTKSQLRVINLIYAVTEWNTNEHLQFGLGLAGPLGILVTTRLRYTVLPDVHVGLSNQFLFPPLLQGFSNNLLALGDAHAMVTVGNENRFFNLGTGILYNTEFNESAWGHRMAIGGSLSAKWHLYAEGLLVLGRNNDFNPRDVSFLPSVNGALGVRRHRWQFGVFSVFTDTGFSSPVPVPYVGYAYYWGGNR